jgi:ABC-type transporter Mla subunit MlaD
MALPSLPRIDNVPIESEDFNDDFEKWITNLVDNLNSILDQLDSNLAAIDARLIACGC